MYKEFVIYIIACTLISCNENSYPTDLSDCWNLNKLDDSVVNGSGLFIVSMHGLSLQAQGCSDSEGKNLFILNSNSKELLRSFMLSKTKRMKYVKFKFSGRVRVKNGKSILYIEKLVNIQEAERPIWMKVIS